MNSKVHQVRVTNRKLSRSAIVPAETFVDLKRKLVTELRMSGWFSVKVYKAESFEDITEQLLQRDIGTNVTINTFPYINFAKSILVVTRTEKPNIPLGRTVMVVHQGHGELEGIDLLGEE